MSEEREEATAAIATLVSHGRREMAKVIVGQAELVDGVRSR